MTSIVQLANFPTRRPRHGGQLRAHHIARALECAGFIVERMPVFPTNFYPAAGDDAPTVDLLPAIAYRRYPDVGEVSDMTVSELAATDNGGFAMLAARLDAAQPDIVMLEEPWLWPALRRWLAAQTARPPVVFNAYNVESHAKAAILTDAKVAEAEHIIAEVEALERDLVRAAAGVTTTTAEDAAILQRWTDHPVTVAPNGTVARQTAHLHGILPRPLGTGLRFVLFVGSAHPPNATGFMTMAVPALPELRSNERIVVAGGVCQLLASRLEPEGTNFLVRDRIVLFGQVSDFALSCLLGNASGILLPITYGGGSNLKTPEALISGLPVVGTPQAFRGFSEFADFPGVTIADTPESFAAGIRGSLDRQSRREPVTELRQLLWVNTLRPIVELAHSLSG